MVAINFDAPVSFDSPTVQFDAGEGGTNATVTPATVACTAAVPAITFHQHTTPTPARVVATAAIPSVSFSLSATAQPATVTGTTAVPGSWPQLNQLVQPLVAVPPDAGRTTAPPVNDGHTNAEKRTS